MLYELMDLQELREAIIFDQFEDDIAELVEEQNKNYEDCVVASFEAYHV